MKSLPDAAEKRFLQRLMMEKDYYATLEINSNAHDGEIKQAYRRLAMKYYSQHHSDPDANEKFCDIGEAYDVLSDPQKRAVYDKFGEEGLKGGIPVEPGVNGGWSPGYIYHGNPDKTFKQFFGEDNPFADSDAAGSHQASAGSERSNGEPEEKQDTPIERDLYVGLEDLFYGCMKKMKISRQVMNEDGQTYSVKDKILSITVRPGLKDGTRITFPREGDQRPNSIPADIVFILRQKPHPLFCRENDDLIYTADLSLEKALTGFSVNVETLDGRLLTIPVYDIVYPEYSKVVTGEGMPIFGNPSKKGNLILQFNIHFPQELTAEKKQFIKSALSECRQLPLSSSNPQRSSQTGTNKNFIETSEGPNGLNNQSSASGCDTSAAVEGPVGQLAKKQDPPIVRDLYLSLKDLFYGCMKSIKISRREMNEDGHSTSIKDKILSITVKPGLKEGTRITFPREGDQGPNCIPADIVFIVRHKPHPLFWRENDNLIYTADISLEKALTGFSVDVDTLDGRLLTIPVYDIVYPKCSKVVTGEGMPILSNPSKKGNLILQFNIHFPQELSSEKKQLIKSALAE